MNRLYRRTVHAQVRAALAGAKAAGAYNHKGMRGTAREAFVQLLLPPVLYPTMGVCSGVAVDMLDRQSPQTDAIIFDRRVVPPLLLDDRLGIVPCESVLFAIEVKSRLTRQRLRDAVSWAREMKLFPFSPRLATGSFLSSIPCALFAFDTDLTDKSIDDEVNRLRQVVDESNADPHEKIWAPLSALTVATRGHAACVVYEGGLALPRVEWGTFPNATRAEGVVRFLSWVNTHAPALSAERATISLSGYLLDE